MQLIDKRITTDKAILNQLQEAGDDDQLVRLIDHSFTSLSESKLASLQQSLEQLDFGDFHLFEAEEEALFVLECTSIDCTEYHNISKTSVLMALLAEHFAVDYDGWGCSVATEQ